MRRDATEAPMLVVHATQKLLDRLGTPTVAPDTLSTTLLGSWYATALVWRPQVALFVNERALLPLLMPLAPAATLLERLPSWIDTILDAHGVPRTLIDAELAQAGEIGLAKTNNRSALGVMNEFVPSRRLAEGDGRYRTRPDRGRPGALRGPDESALQAPRVPGLGARCRRGRETSTLRPCCIAQVHDCPRRFVPGVLARRAATTGTPLHTAMTETGTYAGSCRADPP
jgi:hypothetical protein